MQTKTAEVLKVFHEVMDQIVPYDEASAIAKIRDGQKCCGCYHDGSEYRLETHHRNKNAYGAKGSYIPCRPSDLTTFCVKCHDLHTDKDRAERYAGRELPTIVTENSIPHLSSALERTATIIVSPTCNVPPLSLPLKRV